MRDASTTGPRTMVCGIVINGIVSLSKDIAILCCAGSLDDALNPDNIYPFIEIIIQAVDSRPRGA